MPHLLTPSACAATIGDKNASPNRSIGLPANKDIPTGHPATISKSRNGSLRAQSEHHGGEQGDGIGWNEPRKTEQPHAWTSNSRDVKPVMYPKYNNHFEEANPQIEANPAVATSSGRSSTDFVNTSLPNPESSSANASKPLTKGTSHFADKNDAVNSSVESTDHRGSIVGKGEGEGESISTTRASTNARRSSQTQRDCNDSEMAALQSMLSLPNTPHSQKNSQENKIDDESRGYHSTGTGEANEADVGVVSPSGDNRSNVEHLNSSDQQGHLQHSSTPIRSHEAMNHRYPPQDAHAPPHCPPSHHQAHSASYSHSSHYPGTTCIPHHIGHHYHPNNPYHHGSHGSNPAPPAPYHPYQPYGGHGAPPAGYHRDLHLQHSQSAPLAGHQHPYDDHHVPSFHQSASAPHQQVKDRGNQASHPTRIKSETGFTETKPPVSSTSAPSMTSPSSSFESSESSSSREMRRSNTSPARVISPGGLPAKPTTPSGVSPASSSPTASLPSPSYPYPHPGGATSFRGGSHAGHIQQQMPQCPPHAYPHPHPQAPVYYSPHHHHRQQMNGNHGMPPHQPYYHPVGTAGMPPPHLHPQHTMQPSHQQHGSYNYSPSQYGPHHYPPGHPPPPNIGMKQDSPSPHPSSAPPGRGRETGQDVVSSPGSVYVRPPGPQGPPVPETDLDDSKRQGTIVNKPMESPPYQQQEHPSADNSGGTSINSVAQWQHAQRLTGTPPSANKCVPLKGPIPSKFWGDMEKAKEAYIPAFDQLVNYPDYLPKNLPNSRSSVHHASVVTSYNAAHGVTSKKRIMQRHCVMCGKSCVCTASSTASPAEAAARRQQVQQEMNSADVGSRTGSSGATSPGPIIPRQNKGLCTKCDVTVWVITHTGLEIKWCKGCKNFRPWAAFGDKGLATKCVKCRERQKEKYAAHKKEQKTKTKRKQPDNDDSSNDCDDDGGCDDAAGTVDFSPDDKKTRAATERMADSTTESHDKHADDRENTVGTTALASTNVSKVPPSRPDKVEPIVKEQREEQDAKEKRRLEDDAASGLSHLIDAVATHTSAV